MGHFQHGRQASWLIGPGITTGLIGGWIAQQRGQLSLMLSLDLMMIRML
jgi:hypothetical protein